MEQEAELEVAVKTHPKHRQDNIPLPTYTEEVKDSASIESNSISSDQVETVRHSKNKPYYDCPIQPWNSSDNNGKDGKAIIKADPFDCSCYYYCNWGIHYVDCCTWLTLWNNDILACDWFWNVQCST